MSLQQTVLPCAKESTIPIWHAILYILDRQKQNKTSTSEVNAIVTLPQTIGIIQLLKSVQDAPITAMILRRSRFSSQISNKWIHPINMPPWVHPNQKDVWRTHTRLPAIQLQGRPRVRQVIRHVVYMVSLHGKLLIGKVSLSDVSPCCVTNAT